MNVGLCRPLLRPHSLQLSSLCIALRLQLGQSVLGGVQGQLQGQAALHQPIRCIGLLRQRVANQALGQRVFGVAALLAQGGQKLLELVAFLGGHGRVLGLGDVKWPSHYWPFCTGWTPINP